MVQESERIPDQVEVLLQELSVPTQSQQRGDDGPMAGAAKHFHIGAAGEDDEGDRQCEEYEKEYDWQEVVGSQGPDDDADPEGTSSSALSPTHAVEEVPSQAVPTASHVIVEAGEESDARVAPARADRRAVGTPQRACDSTCAARKAWGHRRRRDLVPSRIWLRQPQEVTDAEYLQLYRSLCDAAGCYFAVRHCGFEIGGLRFRAILYFPRRASSYKQQMWAYANHVFIRSVGDELMPEWLDFVSGVIDYESSVPTRPMSLHEAFEEVLERLEEECLTELTTMATRADYREFHEQHGANLERGVEAALAQAEQCADSETDDEDPGTGALEAAGHE